MASFGRQVCHMLVDHAADFRRYAAVLTEAGSDLDAAADLLEIAERSERLVPRILAFEGEQMRALPPSGGSS